jgi:hypothetical protein
MTTIETLEKKLRESRTELALAQKRLTETLAREKRLSESRGPLSRIAKLRGDKAAQTELGREHHGSYSLRIKTPPTSGAQR